MRGPNRLVSLVFGVLILSLLLDLLQLMHQQLSLVISLLSFGWLAHGLDERVHVLRVVVQKRRLEVLAAHLVNRINAQLNLIVVGRILLD